jgi:hypothetical protein
MLDNADPNNPTWRRMAGFEMASYVAGVANGQTYTVELTMEDPGTGLFPSAPGAMIAARCDLVSPEDAASTAYLPRICTNLELAIERYDALPAGLRWNPDQTGRVVTPGEGTRMRMGFNGSDSLGLKQIELRSEGIAKSSTNLFQTLFPKFDNKGRAIVDYNTDVAPKAILGYRVLRGTLASNDGGTAVMQESYRIAPLLDFDLIHDRNSVSEKDRTERIVVFLRSNSDHKVTGIFKIAPPAGFTVKDNDQVFGIYPKHGSIKRSFDLTMPADAHGTYPIKLQAVMGLKTLEQTAYIIVE